VGVNFVSISRWENGKQQPRAYTVRQLCRVLEASPADLGLDTKLSEGVALTEMVSKASKQELLVLETVDISLLEPNVLLGSGVLIPAPLTMALEAESS
jgi:hypothetical protein